MTASGRVIATCRPYLNVHRTHAHTQLHPSAVAVPQPPTHPLACRLVCPLGLPSLPLAQRSNALSFAAVAPLAALAISTLTVHSVEVGASAVWYHKTAQVRQAHMPSAAERVPQLGTMQCRDATQQKASAHARCCLKGPRPQIPVDYTHPGFPDPPDSSYPQPNPAKTHTRQSGCGFWWVWVRVSLKHPRVTPDNP